MILHTNTKTNACNEQFVYTALLILICGFHDKVAYADKCIIKPTPLKCCF